MRRGLIALSVGLIFLASTASVSIVLAENVVVANGKTVSFDYTLTVDGAVVESSQGKKPLQYVHGQGKIIPGLEKQLAGLKVGDEKKIVVPVDQAYGQINPKAVQEVQKSSIPADIKLTVGTMLQMSDPSGNNFPAKVKEIKDKTVVMDFNHPLAGKELTFQVKIVDIK